MSLPTDLQVLPSQALDVIRYLGHHEQGADMFAIMDGTGLSERAFGKAIRRLVTKYYVSMPSQGFYMLTPNGKQAALNLRAVEGDSSPPPLARPSSPATSATAPAAAPAFHRRRMSALVPQALAVETPVIVMVGFDAPQGRQPALKQPGRVVLRLSAPGCEIDPPERPLEVSADQPAGPVRFRLVPRQLGQVRIKLEAYQLVTVDQLVLLGGMYVDLPVIGALTPQQAELKPLGAAIDLHPG